MFSNRVIFYCCFIALLGLMVGACGDAELEPELEADAIVVGAGISGLSAAVEMGRGGVNVLVLDMNSVMGGHAVMAGGFAVVDTPIQSREGFQDSPELAYRDWMEWTEDGDPEWTRYYAENSRRMIYDWAEEMGAEWVRVAYGWENSVPRFHYTDRGALGVVLALFRTALALPNVSFRWNEYVENLVVEGGRVTGVVTRNLRTGAIETLSAAHVVLATGGFEGNLERVRSNWSPDLPQPDRLLIGASIHATGSGHDLAEAAGAALIKMDRHYIYNNGIVDPRDPTGTLAITGGNDDSLWVNAQGHRFTNETGFDKRILVDLLDQDPATYWAIFDESARGTFAMRGREWVKNPMDGHPVLD
ncbi:MAG: FAD-dependent oxidoreductase, partial [Gammaproteobacteria bacterium]